MSEVKFSTETPEQFMEYFRGNYPGPNTIISNPDWHAPKIYRAAAHAIGLREIVSVLEAVLASDKDAVEVGCRHTFEEPFRRRIEAALAKARGEQ